MYSIPQLTTGSLFFSNWKMTAALSYKAIKSAYLGEHGL